MIELISIDNIFNYIPPAIRRMENDDDQIKSWAYQGFRKLNYPNLRYMQDLIFLEVKNHEADWPSGIKQIMDQWYLAEVASEEQLNYLFSECQCSEEDKPNLGFDDCMPIYHQLFLDSGYFNDCWYPMNYKSNVVDDYVCNHYNWECDAIFSLNTDRTKAMFSFKEGIAAFKVRTNLCDDKGNILIPSEPIELWEYMANCAMRRHWENRAAMKEQGAMQMMQQYKVAEQVYLNKTRGRMGTRSLRLKDQINMIYNQSRLIALPNFLHKEFNNRYFRDGN